MLPTVANIFLPRNPSETTEQILTLLEGQSFRLEQVVSHGQATELGYWYDQPKPEWVLLVRGTARLHFEEGETLRLTAGDYILLPARSKHRVEACSLDAIWLALHFQEGPAP